MMVAVWFGAYLVLHFALYATLFRHQRLTGTERGVFLYHLVPAAAWVIGLSAFALAVPAVGVTEVFLVGALHGIYSLSFLELWALADGGYSLAILERLESGGGQRAGLGDMEQLGKAKNQARLADLVRSGLVEDRGGSYRLTAAGRAAAGLIALIVCVADVPMSD